MEASAAKAFRLQVASFSSSKNVTNRSGASGSNSGRCVKMEAIAKVAFFRTYACRCVRHARTGSRVYVNDDSRLYNTPCTYAKEALQARHPVAWFYDID
jgi:hypothetical protein